MTARAVALDPATHARQVRQTRQALDTIDDTSLVSLSGLGIPEVQALKQEIAEIFPASNLPSFLLQGLLQLKDRTLPPERIQADLRVLFRGTRQIGLFSTFLAAPALVIYGYQQLLTLAGKDVESAFPDGLWQFYTEFGLREDTARHSLETVGFQQTWSEAGELDAAACWVYTAVQTIFAYDALLANEWHERVLLRCLDEALEEHAAKRLGRKLPRKPDRRGYALAEQVAHLRREFAIERIAADWVAACPYSAPACAQLEAYATYRREQFEDYLDQALRALPAELRAAMRQRYAQRAEGDLPAYQRQMTILMRLRPELYQEHHDPIPLDTARVAVVVGGRYYLIDVCDRDPHGHLLVFPADGSTQSTGVALPLTRGDDGRLYDRYGRGVTIGHAGVVSAGGDRLGRLRPRSIAAIKGQVRAILDQASPVAAPADAALPTDMLLAQAPRVRQNDLRSRLNAITRAALHDLGHAAIVINWDRHDGTLPLRTIRQTQRGCGDHALTLIRTDRSMVFDLSHIFFDGIWGMALAEILTGFATGCYPQVAMERPSPAVGATALPISDNPGFRKDARVALADSPIEIPAETSAVDLAAISTLRRRLDKIRLALTVNDLLLLARSAHAASYDPYRPGSPVQAVLEQISRLEDGHRLRHAIDTSIATERAINPALLIPMDASGVDPRLRLFPATFRNPVPEMIPRLTRCAEMVDQLRQREDAPTLRTFEQERRTLYGELQTFSLLLQALKQVTMRGESFTTTSLRLLAHLPGPVQHLMTLVPQKIGILNEIIKGREVFSNVGQVAPGSSLTRFASSRDDGETKLLVWGVLTDAHGQLYVTLRDFRPHVVGLWQRGHTHPARALTQDYLDAYAESVNRLIRDIQRVFAYKRFTGNQR